MTKSLKISLYIFLFGLLTFLAATFLPIPQNSFTKTEVLGEKSNLSLFIEPTAGKSPILSAIENATSEILVETYLLSDPDVISALQKAKERGVTVRVLLEEHPFGGGNLNLKTKPALENSAIEVKWANPSFLFTHQKSIVFDQKTVCILNMNLTRAAFTTNREYNLCTDDPKITSEVTAIFTADWEQNSFTPKPTNLIVSPENSRAKMTAFLNSAEKEIDIAMEVLDDDKILELLNQKSQSMPVKILVPPFSKIEANKIILEKLPQAEIRILEKPYLHAKLIIIDHLRAYIGSINLTDTSLDRNRELGILLSQPDILDRLNQSFSLDWQNAHLASLP